MRKMLWTLGVLFLAAQVFAEEVTLPAAASIVGGAPFFSDVRVFNTSYADSLTVTADYHCFIPQPCSAGDPSVEFTLAPRESRVFNDIVATTFQAPDTAGGIEFEFSGGQDQLVVTSRLYSTAPTPTVGMFIPGLDNSEAHPTTVLTSIRNGGADLGFRTNVGVYNREDAAVNVTFTIFDAGVQVGNPVTRSVAGHSGTQVSPIFASAGAPNHTTENAVIVVSTSGEVFSYAAVIDNNTTDPIFVRGAEDLTPQGAPASRTVQVGQNGFGFLDDASHSSTTQIQVGGTVTWVWSGSMSHGVSSGMCSDGGGGSGYLVDGYGGVCEPDGAFSSGSHEGPFSFSHRFTQAGSFAYFCPVHGSSMRGRVVVSAP